MAVLTLSTSVSFGADTLSQINRSVAFGDSIGWNSTPGVIFSLDSNGSSSPCEKAFKSSKCAIESPRLDIFNALSSCDSDFSSPCIENIWAQSESGSLVKGIYSGERIPPWDLYSFSANKQLQLSQARRSNLYTFPGIQHQQGDLFEVIPNLRRSVLNGVLQPPTSLTTTVQGVYIDKSESPPTYPTGIISGEARVAAMYRCMETTSEWTKDCWKPATQSKPINFRLDFRLPSMPSGWVNGRLSRPEVIFEQLAITENQPIRVVVSGETLLVPNLEKQYFFAQQNEKEVWDKLTSVFGLPWSFQFSAGPAVGPTSIREYASSKVQDPTMDIATQVNAKWVSNLDWQNALPANTQCRKAGFLGYVGSNSLTYASTLPSFDPLDGSLNYQVSSPHFMPNGKAFNGYYELLVDENYARCIWGLSNAPIKASISVLNEAGEVKVVTTSVGVKNGILNFQAAGFTFSTNTIKAKLELVLSAPSPTPTPVVTPSASPTDTPTASAKKIVLKSITCQKGKVKKKITSANPKCPAGYKKI